MKVKYLRRPNNGTQPRLTIGQTYQVLGLSDQSFRIINNAKEPMLYARQCFEIVDPKIPQDWIRRDYDDGEYHIAPGPCSEPGFYEDFFDGDPRSIKIFREVFKDLLD